MGARAQASTVDLFVVDCVYALFFFFFFLIGISIAEQVKIRRLVEMQFMRHATNTFYALLIDFSSANIHSIEAVRLQRKFHSRKKKHLNCLHAIWNQTTIFRCWFVCCWTRARLIDFAVRWFSGFSWRRNRDRTIFFLFSLIRFFFFDSMTPHKLYLLINDVVYLVCV